MGCYVIYFGDETSTGQFSALRGLFKAVVAAKWPDDQDTAWYVELSTEVRKRLHTTGEVKSSDVRLYIASNERAKRTLDDRVSHAWIYIFDPMEQTRDILRRVSKWAGTEDDPEQLLAILRSGRTSNAFARKILEQGRRGAILDSVVPKLEALLGRAASGMALRPGMETPMRIFDRTDLLQLSEREFSELVSRLALALGDALDPERVTQAYLTEGEGRFFVNPGPVAYRLLRSIIPQSLTFDIGNARAFARLKAAYSTVIDTLDRSLVHDHAEYSYRLDMADSRRYAGLQIADVAASWASECFETNYPPHERACEAVKNRFARVLFNDVWL